MKYYRTTLTIFLLYINTLLSSLYAQDAVNWQPIQQAETLGQKQQKKILINIFTTWSEGSKELDRTLINQDYMAKYLNDNFIAVKLDAETKEDVVFKGKTYKLMSQKGVNFNELAAELMNGQIHYPTLVFLEPNGTLIQTIQYRSPEQFEMIIRYFGDDNYKKMTWKKYEKCFVSLKPR